MISSQYNMLALIIFGVSSVKTCAGRTSYINMLYGDQQLPNSILVLVLFDFHCLILPTHIFVKSVFREGWRLKEGELKNFLTRTDQPKQININHGQILSPSSILSPHLSLHWAGPRRYQC